MRQRDSLLKRAASGKRKQNERKEKRVQGGRRMGYCTEEKVSRQRGWLRRSRRKETREHAAKVSLILISISWCDVYLTTRVEELRAAISLSLSLSLSVSFSLSFLSLSSFLFVFSRAEIPQEMFYSETPQASAKVETNCCPSTSCCSNAAALK